MVSVAEYWKVEEHEPVNPHLWAEMSPLPTRLNRQSVKDVNESVSQRHPNANVHVRRSQGTWRERSQTMKWHRLAGSKDKDCDRQPNQYAFSPTYERGKA